MTAKEFLSQYRWLNATINSKIEQARRMRELATAISPSSGFGSSGGDISDKVGKTVAKLVDAEEEINADIDRLVELRKEIEGTIQQLDDKRLRDILERRYILGQKWEKIAVDLNIELRWIYRLHGRALQKLTIEIHY